MSSVWPDLPDDPAKAALEIATWGATDGAHHKQWVIDQMVRALTACPIVEKTAVDAYGAPYTFTGFGESAAYLQWCKDFQGDPDEYGPWDIGIAP